MEHFWDERAREDAAYFVDNLLDYGNADMEDFWARGRRAVAGILEPLGVELQPTDEVVEIGCGIGRLTRVMAERAERVWAFDVSSEMLRQARELLGDLDNVEWLHGDGSTLAPVADGAASACFSFVVFQHLPDPAITLAYVTEMGRVLRPGGWSAFQISNDPSVHRPRGGLRGRLKALTRRGPRGQTHPAWLGSAVDLADLERTAGAAGLDVERVLHPGTQFCLVLLRKRP
jgi:ubiquinone/menaquinone biosynthesis C-methylase UbiE